MQDPGTLCLIRHIQLRIFYAFLFFNIMDKRSVRIDDPGNIILVDLVEQAGKPDTEIAEAKIRFIAARSDPCGSADNRSDDIRRRFAADAAQDLITRRSVPMFGL